MKKTLLSFVVLSLQLSALAAGNTFNVRDYGAKGDGIVLDTAAINQAIAACAKGGGGEVLLPAGRYRSGTIHLCSRLAFHLGAGAELIGSTNLDDYQQPAIPASLPEAKLGKWHRALIVGENLEDASIIGPGTINGNKVFDPAGEEDQRGPHTIHFVNCRRLVMRDFDIVDSANLAIFFQASDDVEVRNVEITGGWDGVHFWCWPRHWCHNVRIIGCNFFTGDDSIAGRYWDNVVVSQCLINTSCNGVRLFGPAVHLLVNDCLFYGPGSRPHRTSGRTNMLCGIILQPGAWDSTTGLLDDVLLANNTMREVAAPVTVWSRPDNPAGRITISGLNATGVYRSALSAESWGGEPITNVVLRNAQIEFTGGGTAEQAQEKVIHPEVDCRSLPCWGIYLRNVERFTCQDVRLSLARDDFRPVVLAEGVPHLDLDNLRYQSVTGVNEPIKTNELLIQK